MYLLMCTDGDGLSEIVAMFALAEETKEVIQQTVEVFKKHNPCWFKTKVAMSDKDFTVYDALQVASPVITTRASTQPAKQQPVKSLCSDKRKGAPHSNTIALRLFFFHQYGSTMQTHFHG